MVMLKRYAVSIMLALALRTYALGHDPNRRHAVSVGVLIRLTSSGILLGNNASSNVLPVLPPAAFRSSASTATASRVSASRPFSSYHSRSFAWCRKCCSFL
ncbi:hypothetical protein PR048_006916 [Dryococelus australis]|uniref:Secreted protein n=1 Tax=Dryococelus australis TaxID=614101 RepID=A0ABQ9ICC8_9NEOP|nr:hypothetical protein PR048_006916 [Dryococelus australis]